MKAETEKYESFSFKEFSIAHRRSAMKVGTDGVLLGAWTEVGDARVIWDVGSGSGLIALMLAQRCEAEIYGIELDHDAFEDMQGNFSGSKWANRLHPVEGDINDVCSMLPAPDLIVCNPPFFVDSLAAKSGSRTLARHEATLGCESVVRLASASLVDGGRLAIIAPMDRWNDIVFACDLYRMQIVERVEISTSVRKPATRMLCMLEKSTGQLAPKFERRSLRDSEGVYSDWYRQLTQAYYLHLK